MEEQTQTEEISPESVVTAIFSQFKVESKFYSNIPKIHEEIYVLSREKRFKKLLGHLVFEKNFQGSVPFRIYPRCAAVTRAIIGLERDGFLECIGKSEIYILVSKPESNLVLKDKEEKALIREIAKKLLPAIRFNRFKRKHREHFHRGEKGGIIKIEE